MCFFAISRATLAHAFSMTVRYFSIVRHDLKLRSGINSLKLLLNNHRAKHSSTGSAVPVWRGGSWVTQMIQSVTGPFNVPWMVHFCGQCCWDRPLWHENHRVGWHILAEVHNGNCCSLWRTINRCRSVQLLRSRITHRFGWMLPEIIHHNYT